MDTDCAICMIICIKIIIVQLCWTIIKNIGFRGKTNECVKPVR